MRKEIEIFAPYGRKTEDYVTDDGVDKECLTREVTEILRILVENGEIDLELAKRARLAVKDSLSHESYQVIDEMYGSPRRGFVESKSPIIVKANGNLYGIPRLPYDSRN